MADEKLGGFDVMIEARGVNLGKFRNDIDVAVRIPTQHETSLATDEGAYHGGEATAPSPLAYFTTSLNACLMTQIRAFSKRLGIPLTTITVNTRFEWRADQAGRAPYEATALAFTVDAELGGEASEADQLRLFRAAQKGCFVEQSLKPGLAKHRLKRGDLWIEADA